MKPNGLVRTYEPIANLSLMPTMVECVKELPDANAVPISTVFRLIDSQVGYIAMHFYVCIADGTTHVWEDITDDPGMDECDTAVVTLRKEMVSGIMLNMILSYSGFPSEIKDTENNITDVFDHDVLVGNNYGIPTNEQDGTVLFSTTSSDGVTNYKVAFDRMGRASTGKFRLFRVFKSGYVMYADVELT